MIKLEEYFQLCTENILINKNGFKKVDEPKISIITPIYNKGKTVTRYLRSIQNQPFEDLEIIFIDDRSTDNTLKIIEELQEQDERIILIKNKKRQGTLRSRKIGVYKSKGEFLLFVDPDDMIEFRINTWLQTLGLITHKDIDNTCRTLGQVCEKAGHERSP